jgi:glycosyltransferase involved in cell wall biosynthesis
LTHGSDNICFLGHLHERQLQRLYQKAVALLVPSIAYEVFPLVAIEALRQQTPVIARNLGGLPEIVTESGGGFVYDAEEELVASMDRLLRDPALRDELGRRGYQAYQHNWTAEAHLRRYFALISDIAATSVKR